MIPAKKIARKTARKAAAVAPKKKRGNMTSAEIKPLVIAARKAYDVQSGMDLTDGLSFDDWRREQVMACVGREGLTACNHDDYRPLLAHFQTLAGDDSAALGNLLRSGHKTDHADTRDTQEKRSQLAFTIAEKLAYHLYIASNSVEQILADGQEAWVAQNPGEIFTGPDPAWLSDLRSRKHAIAARDNGPLGVGYLISIVRQKTRRKDLQLGTIWQDGLAERCTVPQLEQILYTLVNRINAAEGVRETERGRNKGQRSGKYRAAKEQKMIDPRW